MTRVRLHHAIEPARKRFRTLDLRQPSQATINAMARVHSPEGFSDADAIRLASRLSGHSIATIRKLRNDDLAAVKVALEALFAAAQRDQAARPATAKGAGS